jgi:PKD repeat protein
MADHADGDRVSSRLTGWLKGLLTTLLGLCSGAVLMYASPLIDRVVKPAKPLANFAAQPQGLSVAFQNRTTGGTEGWWDFGDGSALEPFLPSQPVVNHSYPKPGIYPCKLSVRNLIGEEHERTVSINIDDSKAPPPAIEALTAVPLQASTYAPATFRITSKIKNAELCVWVLGHEKPLEIVSDGTADQERTVTFKRPGNHVIRLAAFHGKQATEKTVEVTVNAPPRGSATVALNIKREAVQIQTKTTTRNIPVPFPAQSRETKVPLNVSIPADPECQFTDARVLGVHFIENLKAEISPDRLQIRLTGQQTRPTGLLKVPHNVAPAAVVELQTTQARQMPSTSLNLDPVANTVMVPGSALLPVPKLQAGWQMKQQLLGVEVRDGDRVVWQSAQLPASGLAMLQGRSCQVNAILAGDQVRVDLVPMASTPALRPLGN